MSNQASYFKFKLLSKVWLQTNHLHAVATLTLKQASTCKRAVKCLKRLLHHSKNVYEYDHISKYNWILYFDWHKFTQQHHSDWSIVTCAECCRSFSRVPQFIHVQQWHCVDIALGNINSVQATVTLWKRCTGQVFVL